LLEKFNYNPEVTLFFWTKNSSRTTQRSTHRETFPLFSTPDSSSYLVIPRQPPVRFE
jgi:hypothetical protein